MCWRSRRYLTSGTTKSTPNISSSGNISPQSMTTISSPYSKTYMFLPISPTPPSGMMRSVSAIRRATSGSRRPGRLDEQVRFLSSRVRIRVRPRRRRAPARPRARRDVVWRQPARRARVATSARPARRARAPAAARALGPRRRRRRVAARLDQRVGQVAHVLEHRLLEAALAQRRGGVIHRVRHGVGRACLWISRRTVPCAPLMRSPGIEIAQRVTTQGDHDGRIEHARAGASGTACRPRSRAGSGHDCRRAALDDVGDENVRALPADLTQQVVEQVAGGANERTALLILVITWTLADEDDLCVG